MKAITDLAKEAGFGNVVGMPHIKALERFADLVRAEYETPLKLAEEALVKANHFHDYEDALAAVREALTDSKPAPDGRIPKTVFTLDDISKAAEIGRQAGMIDALAEPVKQEPVAWHEPNAYGNVTTHKKWAEENGWLPLYTKE